jgi:hypothetical protein
MDALGTRISDAVARTIYSRGFVAFFMLAFTNGMIFISHELFVSVMPARMEPWKQILSTGLIAVTWEYTALMAITNVRHVPAAVSWIISISTTLIMICFTEAYDFSQPFPVMAQRLLMSALVGTMAKLLPRLFHAKSQEVHQTGGVHAELVKANAALNESKKALQEAGSEVRRVQSIVDERDAELKQIHAAMKARESRIVQLESIAMEYDRYRLCPHCQVLQDNPLSLNAHKGHCKKKPKPEDLTKETVN